MLRIAGMATLAVTVVRTVAQEAGLWSFVDDRILDASAAHVAAWLLAAGVYGTALWLAAGAIGRESVRRRACGLVAAQAATSTLMIHLVPTGLTNTQLLLVAVQLGLFLPWRTALAFAVALTLLQGWIDARHFDMARVLWIYCGSKLPQVVLALVISHLIAREAEARTELAGANAELRATQVLVAEKSRMAERVSIAREVHDLLGHHLTALSLHLEAASHLARDRPVAQLRRGQVLTKQLLSDVRAAVSTMRAEDKLNVAKALTVLTADVLQPRIHLHLPADLDLVDPERAQRLVRCVQEVVIDAATHAYADNLWIDVSVAADTLHIHVRDDGLAGARADRGAHLRSVADRLEQLGGRLRVAVPPATGFSFEASLRLTGRAS